MKLTRTAALLDCGRRETSWACIPELIMRCSRTENAQKGLQRSADVRESSQYDKAILQMTAASVVICAHNPRTEYLDRVLQALRGQSINSSSWELLLVDNASDQPLESRWDLSWHAKGRHLKESNLGLAWARYRGIRESIGDILIFVDDDNVLGPEYLARTIEIANSWPMLGAWGAGTILPEFEVQPAEHLKEHLPTLALRRLNNPRWTNVLPCLEATPWGAGLCVRRSVAEAFVKLGEEAKIAITGRSGTHLLGGEDNELCFVAASCGLGVGIFPELQLTHLIPRERLSDSYIVRLREGIEISNVLLEHKWLGTRPRSPFSVRSLLGLAKNMLVTRGLQRRMYLAYWRAPIRAKRMIDQSQSIRRTRSPHAIARLNWVEPVQEQTEVRTGSSDNGVDANAGRPVANCGQMR